MFTNSIRWRLQLWLAFLLVSLLSGFGFAVYELDRTTRLHQIDQQLEHRLAALSGNLVGFRGNRPFEEHHDRLDTNGGEFGRRGHRDRDHDHDWDRDRDRERNRTNQFNALDKSGLRPLPAISLAPDVASLFASADTNGFYFVVWNREGALRLSSSNAPANLPIFEPVDSASGPRKRARGTYRESFLQHTIGYQVLVGRDISPELISLGYFKWSLVAAGGAIVVLGIAIGWWLTSGALRPLEKISAAARRISEGNLSERIQAVHPENEIGRLAAVLNSTFARLEAAFTQQKQFTADASHELRTPLAVMISEAQTALARDRTSAEYRETVEACLVTAQQMRHLSESLLELARFDAAEEPAERQDLNLAQHTRACVERIRPLAAQQNLKIQTRLDPADIHVNPVHLDRVILNLLTNAIHYNKPDGEIHVITRKEHDSAILIVADTGVGISAEDLPHIFKRFYRADKSRARADGRSGLGLAICQAILDASGGTIEVKSELGAGTTFTVRYPLANPSSSSTITGRKQ